MRGVERIGMQSRKPQMGALFKDGLADGTVGRNIILTLIGQGGFEYLHRSPASRRRR
jgi:hypothetical protein